MALTKQAKYKGVTLSAGYYKVATAIHEYMLDDLKIIVNVYADVKAREDNEILTGETYVTSYQNIVEFKQPDDENDRAAIYRWLKSQPEFRTAQDA